MNATLQFYFFFFDRKPNWDVTIFLNTRWLFCKSKQMLPHQLKSCTKSNKRVTVPLCIHFSHWPDRAKVSSHFNCLLFLLRNKGTQSLHVTIILVILFYLVINFVIKHILHLLKKDSKLIAAVSLPWKQQSCFFSKVIINTAILLSKFSKDFKVRAYGCIYAVPKGAFPFKPYERIHMIQVIAATWRVQ